MEQKVDYEVEAGATCRFIGVQVLLICKVVKVMVPCLSTLYTGSSKVEHSSGSGPPQTVSIQRTISSRNPIIIQAFTGSHNRGYFL